MWQKIKVIELASVLAGPLVGTFFAELGAQVLKIENKTSGGDVTRKWKLPTEDPTNKFSAYYASANYGKEVVFLDLKAKEDFERAIALIMEADIIIQNFKSGDAEKLALDGTSLLQLNPKLIIACISGFGTDNNRPAFDVVLQAETGYMYMNGNPSSGPTKMPVALIDVLAAHHLKEAILIALLEKERSGKGKIVQVSLYDAAIASLANQASNYLMEGHIPQAMGAQHPNIAPYGDMYLTKDKKYLVLAIGNDLQFSKLYEVLQIDKQYLNQFKTNVLRLKGRIKLNEIIANCMFKLNVKEAENLFLKNKIPYGIVKNLAEVFEGQAAQNLIITFKIDKKVAKRVKTFLT